MIPIRGLAAKRLGLPFPLSRLTPPVCLDTKPSQRLYATLLQQTLQPDPDPVPNNLANSDNISTNEKDGFHWRSTSFKMFETALTTFASIAILG